MAHDLPSDAMFPPGDNYDEVVGDSPFFNFAADMAAAVQHVVDGGAVGAKRYFVRFDKAGDWVPCPEWMYLEYRETCLSIELAEDM